MVNRCSARAVAKDPTGPYTLVLNSDGSKASLWGSHLDTSFTLPSSPADRRKLYIALGIFVLCAIWLTYYFGSQMSFRGRDRTLETPGWKASSDIFNKLIADPAFTDIALKVESEKPLKISVMGEVYSKADFERLPGVLKELNSQAEFDIQVEQKKK